MLAARAFCANEPVCKGGEGEEYDIFYNAVDI